MLDLGTPAIEVAIGLAFVFFLFSLVISAAIEGIASLWEVREKKLEKGIERMLGEPNLARDVLNHPLVKVDVTSRKRKPAYVSSRNFALALTQILRRKGDCESEGGGNSETAMKELTKGIKKGYASGTAVREQLDGMLEQSHGDSVAGFRTAAEHWFDDGMDRVSGWYRGWVQIMTCVFALAIAIGLNVDSIRIAERLRDDTALRAAVVTEAEAAVAPAEGDGEEDKEEGGAAAGASEGEEEGGAAETDGGTGTEAGASPEEAAEDAEDALGKIKGLNLPILWDKANANVTLNTAFGWLITFLALSLGAPFWFDALSRLARLKKTGVVPEKAK